MGKTKPSKPMVTAIHRIEARSRKDRTARFTHLIAHFSRENLIACFHELDGMKAVGIDQLSKDDYGRDLETNIEDLVNRMKRMAYRPRAVREVMIPKGDGRKRPLGISAIEDKIVQLMMRKVLEAIFEPVFRDCSYGFRPGRNCHQAIKDVNSNLFSVWSPVVLDIDLENYFGTINHQKLVEFLRIKIADEKFLRYIIRMLKAGIMGTDGYRDSDEGVPQGSICSPVLANVYAHYAIDEWFEETVRLHCPEARLYRYCDDLVVCCKNDRDAQRISKALVGRLARFDLRLNEAKSRKVVMNKGAFRAGMRQGTFDYLGFTFYLGRTRKGGIVPKVKTSSKRYRRKLGEISDWIKIARDKATMVELWDVLRSKLRGHVQYFGVSNNLRFVRSFIVEATRIFFKWMNRRSQRRSMTWDDLAKFRLRHPMVDAVIAHKLF